MKNKPLRRCTGCFQEFPQGDLIRVVRTPKNVVKVCAPGEPKTPGRGAYVCANGECVKKALKAKGRKRCPLHFWLEAPLSDDVHKKLLQLVE
jgi:uncharacterized protein